MGHPWVFVFTNPGASPGDTQPVDITIDPQQAVGHPGLLLRENLDFRRTQCPRVDTHLIEQTLKLTRGNVSRAAEELGMHRKNLHTKLAELDLDPRAFAQKEA